MQIYFYLVHILNFPVYLQRFFFWVYVRVIVVSRMLGFFFDILDTFPILSIVTIYS